MNRNTSTLTAAIAHGMRHVTLPDCLPDKISLVLEYPTVTVRHEFAPDADRLALRDAASLPTEGADKQ